jgi:5-methylcytosine-specific restriction endonuclease McrA
MANKYTQHVRFQRLRGTACPYCKRVMDIGHPDLMPTEDHVHPRSRGGVETVWACWKCNNVKGDMTMPEWEAFMAAHPAWWL